MKGLRTNIGEYWRWVDALPDDIEARVRAILTRQDRGYGVTERELRTLCRRRPWRQTVKAMRDRNEAYYLRCGVPNSSKIIVRWRLGRWPSRRG